MEEEETEQPRQAGPAPRPSDTQKRTNPKAPVRACGAQAPGALVAPGRRLLYPTHRRGHGSRREASTSEPAAKEKPIVVRVKRKPSQTRPDAFCELPFYLPLALPRPLLSTR